MTEEQARTLAERLRATMDRPYENAWPAQDADEPSRWYVVAQWQGEYTVHRTFASVLPYLAR